MVSRGEGRVSMGLPKSATAPPSVWAHLFCGAGHEKKDGRAVEVVPGI